MKHRLDAANGKPSLFKIYYKVKESTHKIKQKSNKNWIKVYLNSLNNAKISKSDRLTSDILRKMHKIL